MMRMIYWAGAEPHEPEKIGSADSKLDGLKAGDTILLRTESGEAERKITSVQINGPYTELTFEPVKD